MSIASLQPMRKRNGGRTMPTRSFTFSQEADEFITERAQKLRVPASQYMQMLVDHDRTKNIIADILREKAEEAAVA